MEKPIQSYKIFLEDCFDNGDYATDDVIAFILPLFEEVLGFHEAELVAPFENPAALFITDRRLDIEELFAHAPQYDLQKIVSLFDKTRSENFTITGHLKMETDVDTGRQMTEDLSIHLNTNEPLQQAAYIKGYNSYEVIAGHHDALTDIFCLGLVLGSMALSLDLYEEEDLKLFVSYRPNPAFHNSRIHPAISALINEMTELDRSKRSADLYDIINRLRHYRDYDPQKQTDLSATAGWVNKELTTWSEYILNKLKNRLFDTSRRNRLLYYKPNMRFVNLTVSSVPTVLHYQSIRPELLFTWNKEISGKVTGMKEILLNKYLRFEDHLYLPSSLDKIRTEAQKDVQEYGFSQLKMVAAFLNWHNLREDKNERIQSPLLLLPVDLKKNKKLKEDHYVVTVKDNVAEVNPVLANHLRELYGIRLPDMVDLDEMSMDQFYEILRSQIEGAGQGITLNYTDKPKIKLVHSVARQTINNYKKRLRKTGGQLESYKNISYSYQPESYKPLGLEIFHQRIEPKTSVLELLVNEDISISSHHLTGENNSKERQLFQLAESEQNPYSWDFDICNMVLGNFNYKKMSLVRDYNHVIDNKVQHAVFEQLFSAEPKLHTEKIFDLNKPGDWYHIITADPTQTTAILQGRTGESYIIQGPPGTGKSQTITNLIADFAARGKSILFVCEKRAALDVVYHRLKQQQLDELCCYIHDSQSDKREFIKDLKSTYEDFIRNKMSVSEISLKRTVQLQQLNEQLELLEIFHTTSNNTDPEAGIKLRKLTERIIELKNAAVIIQPKDEELLPHYKEWLQFGSTITALGKALEETGAEPAFAEHPFSKMNDQLFKSEQPHRLLDELAAQIRNSLRLVTDFLQAKNIPPQHSQKLLQLKNLVQDALLLQPLAESNNLRLVNTNNAEARVFNEKINTLAQLERLHEETKAKNSFWEKPFSEQDTAAALAIATAKENSFFSFLSSSWRKLKSQLKESYRLSDHQVKPSFTSILSNLQQEYIAAAKVASEKQQLQKAYGISNIDLTYVSIEMLRSKQGDDEIDYLLQRDDANELVLQLSKFSHTLYTLEKKLQEFFHSYEEKTINEITDELENITSNADGLKELLPALRSYVALPADLKNALSRISLSPAEAETAIAQKSLGSIYRQNKTFASTDISTLATAVEQIHYSYKKLLKLNAALVRATTRQRFLQNVELGNMAASQLNDEQKKFKKNYNEGRKILENEFSKSMRYKSIRELTAKKSGLVLKDLKPIWLMSPLSVSDSLPLDTSFFDIIIFDEASQITLEEGIPALYRAPQTVIVGDDKQMPPSNFFTARAEDPDDMNNEDNGYDEMLSNDADSLLVQGAKKLNSVMLGWHYRSRYETLISYSNHAFYNAGLLTIPDKQVHDFAKPEIIVNNVTEASVFADTLYDRSMSFHFHPNSIYEKRSNIDEANYIAGLVRELLKREVKESIGIVAFSQEQQHTIEDALTSLAADDKHFEQQLEECYERTEEDQFTGLFVKNLENVQGDERDIIIMSVCYGFDSKRKMIMNFGPINRKGGEKRLNVIFSRAKKHMAVVSSIRHFNITNEYNEGASYFRRFLQYAELVSTGNMMMARTILDGLVAKKDTAKAGLQKSSIVLQEIKQALESKGYSVTAAVGQSDFKCALAVKINTTDNAYTLSILLDDDQHYASNNLLEHYYQRPEILKNFGWKMIFISGKDWLQQPKYVMDQIEKKIREIPAEETDGSEEELFISENLSTKPLEGEAKLFIQDEPKAPVSAYDDLHFRRLVYQDVTSDKFWEAATDGHKLVVRYGRSGTRGQVQIKTFTDFAAADKEKEKMIREKLNKGYKDFI